MIEGWLARLLHMVPMADVLVWVDHTTPEPERGKPDLRFRAGGASVIATGYHVHQRATVQDLAGIRRIPGD